MGNYGIVDELTVTEVGLNAKMSELHAAMGLALLPHMDAALDAREAVVRRYRTALADVAGLECLCPLRKGHNSYAFPVRIGADYPLSRDGLYDRLRQDQIFARRYFYPLISDMPMYRDLASAAPADLPVARDVAEHILCLPLYPDLEPDVQQRIIDIVARPCA